MSGECDKCHEHALDCKCVANISFGEGIKLYPDCIYCKETCEGKVYLTQRLPPNYKYLYLGESIHFSCYITLSVEKEIEEQYWKIYKK